MASIEKFKIGDKLDKMVLGNGCSLLRGTQPSRAKYCFQEINVPFAMNQPTNQLWSYVFLLWSGAPIAFSKSYINLLFASMNKWS
jgi:hypothetical protein